MSMSMPLKYNWYNSAQLPCTSVSTLRNNMPAKSTPARFSNYKYTVLLPTYNERQNLPIIVWMLVKMFVEQ